jgi:hypothetical protein
MAIGTGAAILGSAIIGAGAGMLNKGGGGGGVDGGYSLPGYFTDPAYTKARDYLNKYTGDMTKGILPDYFKGIGETGSPEFNAMAGNVRRDISTGVDEDLARRGIGRGGIGATAKAKGIGDAMTKLNYADFLRSLEGKQYILGTGLVGVGDVMNSALTYGNAMSNYQLKKATQVQTQNNLNNSNQASGLSGLLSAVGSIIGSIKK